MVTDIEVYMEEKNFKKPLKLIPHVQRYLWGRPANQSIIGKLTKEDDALLTAELWLGAHPELPSEIVVGGENLPLNEAIDKYSSELLGSDIVERFGVGLPFLFKVLSIAKPLSIQAHPDKQLALRLYRDKNYPDDNHKPEMAVALSTVELLYGFRQLSAIAVDFTRLPELKECISDDLFTQLVTKKHRSPTQILRQICSTLMQLNQSEIRLKSHSLRIRLEKAAKLCLRDKWALKLLQEEFPDGDVGIFMLYVMNLLQLAPGDAIFIPANTAHAYLSGELMECMANSDNVVRGGLTPKAKDTEILLTMLDYSAKAPSLIKPDEGVFSTTYSIPLENAEFKLEEVYDGGSVIMDSPAIVICMKGEGTLSVADYEEHFSMGDCFYIPESCRNCELSCSDDGSIFIATVPEQEEE